MPYDNFQPPRRQVPTPFVMNLIMACIAAFCGMAGWGVAIGVSVLIGADSVHPLLSSLCSVSLLILILKLIAAPSKL